MKSLEKQYCEVAKAFERLHSARNKEKAHQEKINKLEKKLLELKEKSYELERKKVNAGYKAEELETELYKRLRQTASDCLPAEPSEKKNALFSEMLEQLKRVTGKTFNWA